jgi:hypothetical protein
MSLEPMTAVLSLARLGKINATMLRYLFPVVALLPLVGPHIGAVAFDIHSLPLLLLLLVYPAYQVSLWIVLRRIQLRFGLLPHFRYLDKLLAERGVRMSYWDKYSFLRTFKPPHKLTYWQEFAWPNTLIHVLYMAAVIAPLYVCLFVPAGGYARALGAIAVLLSLLAIAATLDFQQDSVEFRYLVDNKKELVARLEERDHSQLVT